MLSDPSSDSKGIIAGWQTDLEVRTRWKWWTLRRRDFTQHYTFSMASLIKAWSSAETTQRGERGRDSEWAIKDLTKQTSVYAIFPFTADLAQAYTQSFCIILPLPPGCEWAPLALAPVISGTNCFMATVFTVNMVYCDIHPNYFSQRSVVCYKVPMPALLWHRLDQSLWLSVLKLRFCPGVSELVCTQEDPLLIHVKLC